MQTSLTIIVPCYNEEKRGRQFLSHLVDFGRKSLKDYEILLIDDGSGDGTYERLTSIQQKDPERIRLLRNEVNMGKGAAVRKAIFSSGGDAVLFIDADGSISPAQIPSLIEKLENAELAIGCRYSKDSRIEQPLMRRITGALFNLYVNWLFRLRISDCLCGFKAFQRDAARDLFENLSERRWLFDVEILFKAQKRKYRIETLPISWVHRKGTKIKLYDPFLFLFRLVRLRLRLFKKAQ